MNECRTTFTDQLQAQSNGHQKVGSLDLAEDVLSREGVWWTCKHACSCVNYYFLGGREGGRGCGRNAWVGGWSAVKRSEVWVGRRMCPGLAGTSSAGGAVGLGELNPQSQSDLPFASTQCHNTPPSV